TTWSPRPTASPRRSIGPRIASTTRLARRWCWTGGWSRRRSSVGGGNGKQRERGTVEGPRSGAPFHQTLEPRVPPERREVGIDLQPTGREVVGHSEERLERGGRLVGLARKRVDQ